EVGGGGRGGGGLVHEFWNRTGASGRLGHCSAEGRGVARRRLMPDLPEFASELDRRFAEIGRMLEGRPPQRGPTAVPLSLEDGAVASLSPFHRAALLLYRSHLEEIDKLTRDLFAAVADIRNFTRAKIDPTTEAVPALPPGLRPP